ncbi:transcriptional regulator [Vibrio sp. SCSIO 43136]|uniref:winged helix-turn-helix domain-containing protein n=1 Tax=Vibrio sp. SCSIO 43136 TaxID=2819101 RepID=UPI0020761734|nr:transcriptional regulator [Vibrio sp. SCSIO 43136]USD64570.1 transcriptional regulator [Vibrio sp. SCSIO 43136]
MSNIGTKFILAQRFIFDPNSNSLVDQHSENEIIRLGSNESRILFMLAERPNEVVTRQQLHEYVWRDQGFQVDDSSLTQAISTLRKMLKDSTKSPQFVKTVPKRGYQLISSVERSLPNSDTEEPNEELESDVIVPNSDTMATASLEAPSPQPAIEERIAVQPKASPKLSKMGMAVAIVVSALMFTLTYFVTKPSQSQFNTITTVETTVVKTPISHPDMTMWLPTITQCVEAYLENNDDGGAPVEVIATGGQNGQIVLNYIHAPDSVAENVTMKLLAIQPDFNRVCKQ